MNRPTRKNQSSLQKLVEVGGEALLDQGLESGLIREIPVIKTIVAMYKAGKTVSDTLFYHKVERFIREINDITEDEVSKFHENHAENADKVAEGILFALERYDSPDKAAILACLFKKLLTEKFDYQTFLRSTFVVGQLYIDDLLELPNAPGDREFLNTDGTISIEASEALLANGLLTNKGIDGGSSSTGGGYILVQSEIGHLISDAIRDIKSGPLT